MLRVLVLISCAVAALASPPKAPGQESAPPPVVEEAESVVDTVPEGEPLFTTESETLKDPPPPAPGSPDLPAGFLPTPASELTLRYGDELGEDDNINIRDEIDIDLIDLDALRESLSATVAERQLNLSLQECILIALDQNLDIEISEYEPLKAREDIYTARGEFDPILQGSALYTRSNQSQSQQSVAFGGITSVEAFTTLTNGTLAGRLPLGTQYSVSWDMERSESTFSRFIQEYSGTLSLQLTQPLLRGFGTRYNRVRIDIARNSQIATREQLRLTVLNTVADVVNSYWDLVGAIENLKVRSEALDNAERLLKVNETRQEIGTAADIEVLQAKAGVATRQSEYITARQNITDASNFLKSLLNLQDGEVFSSVIIIPIDRPNPHEPSDFDPDAYQARIEAGIEAAMENRPDITIRQMEIDNAALDEYRTRKDMLPQIDLVYTYIAGGRDPKLRDTLEGIRGRQDYAYTYGVQGSIPIFNRAARGAYNRARLNRRQAEVGLEQVRQQLMLNVNLAASQLATNAILVQSNQQATRLQIANVAAEEKRLQLGVTTSWQVLQIQQDLTIAQVQELVSNIEYEKSLVELQLAEGTLLDNMGVSVEPPESEFERVGYWEGITPRWE